MYPDDPLVPARHRTWIEFATQAQTEGWLFLHAADPATADARRAAFRDKLGKLEVELSEGPYFAGASFGLLQPRSLHLSVLLVGPDSNQAWRIIRGVTSFELPRTPLEIWASYQGLQRSCSDSRLTIGQSFNSPCSAIAV
jgi:glutathione S-transferase